MINPSIGYSYQDLRIVPAKISSISSRSECDCFYDDMLPIFASPMSTITNEHNVNIWKRNKITPIIPRNIDYNIRLKYILNGDWVALSLKEFKHLFIDLYIEEAQKEENINNTFKICIDLANGHMQSLYESINCAKRLSRINKKYNLIIMTGNIANPETYMWICKNAEVDYIRISIGTGANCITSSNVGVHYPIASLIDSCNSYRNIIIQEFNQSFVYDEYSKYLSCPKIVADGGIRNYDDVIKALALGADYVMIGSLFTAALESAGEMTIDAYNSHYKYYAKKDGTINDGVNDILNIWEVWSLDEEFIRRNFISEMKSIIKESYGMSTKKAQKLINKDAKLKTSEGCTKYISVKYTINQWAENMIDYLKSAMSYCNAKTLQDFIGKQELKVQSTGTQLLVNK